MTAADQSRFTGLDVLRGAAALGVVFWHWQHFFPNGTMDASRLPLADAAALFYRHGWLAVDLFFCLSGFIFFALYAQRVAAGEIGAARFAWLRFSRLYPLHLLTLLVVALAQWRLSAGGFEPFAYAHNDARHFLLNLGFASSWGMEDGYSFNGPAWSISVEVLLYATFFVFCRVLPLRWPVLLVAACAGFLFAATIYPPIGRGLGSFFLGGLAFSAFRYLRELPHERVWTFAAATLAAAAWTATLWWAARETAGGQAHGLERVLLRAWPLLALFPLTVLALALLESRLGGWLRRLRALGDASYSIYLWHFPLQLLFSGLSIYYSPWFMAAFFAVLLGVSILSHRYFELPVQNWLRIRAFGAARPQLRMGGAC